MLQMLQNAVAWGAYLIESPLITVSEVAGRCPTPGIRQGNGMTSQRESAGQCQSGPS